MVKQEMARLNINILGISELKWTGMVKFNSDDHYTYYCGQEPLRRNGVALIVRKSLKCSTWVQSQKQQNDLSSFPRRTVRYHSYPSQCPTPLKLKKLKLTDFYEDLQHLLELTPKEDIIFIFGNWNVKVEN